MSGMDGSLLSENGSKSQSRPCGVFVLFGATGDLAARKIAPALYNLAADGLLDARHVVLGVARRSQTDEQFREQMLGALREHSRQQPNPEIWNKILPNWHYFQLQADEKEAYAKLARRLVELEAGHGCGGNRLFYLAMTPDTFEDIIRGLGEAGLNKPAKPGGQIRLVVEKPFGHDLESARQLNTLLREDFEESQIFRIDHYLGKESVMNLIALRFANALFEPMLNNHNVEQVQITVRETVGMEGRRGPYFEKAGALRDMIQNHLLQLLAFKAMEVPLRLTATDIRNEKVKVLRALRIMTPEEVAVQTVRGQYGPSKAADSTNAQTAPGYRQEQGVAPDSQVETFVALKVFLENWRWAGVPFLLRTGKRLAAKSSQITVVFRREPISLFSSEGCDLRGPNRLIIRIHPNEGIALIFDAKVPGPDMVLRPVKMEFEYKSAFEWASPEAYEHLLLDAMTGDATLFVRNDEVEAAWQFTDSIRYTWQNRGLPRLVEYPAGTWGPSQAQDLLGDPYQKWYD